MRHKYVLYFSGKKGKKQKGKTLNLNDFLSGGGGGGGGGDSVVAVVPQSSWADEEEDDYYPSSKRVEQVVLPTAPRAARGPEVDEDRVPTVPPFKAYVANLPYDCENEDVKKFFARFKVLEVRLPRDGDPETGRLKGYGYVEFEDRAALIEALGMNQQHLKNRAIRVDLATGKLRFCNDKIIM